MVNFLTPPSCQEKVYTHVAKNSLGSLQQEAPLYTHWLALMMYDVYCEAKIKNLDGVIEFSVDDNIYKIENSVLCNASEYIKSACDLNISELHRAMVSGDEAGMTPLVCRALDRFVFPDNFMLNGAFLHQPTSRKRFADYGLVKFIKTKPYNKAACDAKKMTFRIQRESQHYMVSIAFLYIIRMSGRLHSDFLTQALRY